MSKRKRNQKNTSQIKKYRRVEDDVPRRLQSNIRTANTNEKKNQITTLPVIMNVNDINKKDEYYHKYETLLNMELDYEITEYNTRTKVWGRKLLMKNGYALFDLKCYFSSTIYEYTVLNFESKYEIGDIKFSHGDVIQISKNGPSNGVIMEGIIHAKGRYHVSVACNPKKIPKEVYEGLWRMDKGANSVVYDRMIEALGLLTSHDPDLRDHNRNFAQKHSIKPEYMPPPKASLIKRVLTDKSFRNCSKIASDPSILNSLHDEKKIHAILAESILNESQKKTIIQVLKRRLSLVQGPPGTGKTLTAIQLLTVISKLYKSENIPILATAFTNVATDNLLEGLRLCGVNALRIGSPVKVREELRDCTLSARLLKHPSKERLAAKKTEMEYYGDVNKEKYYSLKRQIREMETTMISDIIREAQVICCTCIGAGDNLLKDQYFPFVLIDESTQAIEPAALVPLTKGAQQVVFLGDHFQLPPTVLSHAANDGGLNDSLFNSLVRESKIDPFILEWQYRMHPTLSYFPSSHFYNGKLFDAVSASERPLPLGLNWRNECPVAFINSTGPEEHLESNSKMNVSEAAIIVEIVRHFMLNGSIKSDIGIITPYAGQVKHLKKIFTEDEFFTQSDDFIEEVGEDALTQIKGGLNVASVDGFQGREKEIIILSTVRSNDKNKIGFLSDWRRLNVAITRGRRGLVVVGNRDCLKSDNHWNSWLEWVEEMGCVFSETDELFAQDPLENINVDLIKTEISDSIDYSLRKIDLSETDIQIGLFSDDSIQIDLDRDSEKINDVTVSEGPEKINSTVLEE